MGYFCPDCLKFVRYSSDFNKMRVGILKENKERRKRKPKFLKKERRACQKCWENGKVNRNKWTIIKIPKKKEKWKPELKNFKSLEKDLEEELPVLEEPKIIEKPKKKKAKKKKS